MERMIIKWRAVELIKLYGDSVQAREQIIESLMAEFEITPDSAIQYLASAKRYLAGIRKGGKRVDTESVKMPKWRIGNEDR
jgi:hypothetical protein